MSNRPRPVVAVTPTAISGSTICERQSILKMTNPISGSASLPLKFGSVVHEAYRALAERSRKTWLKNEMPLEKQIISDADYVMKETLELVKETDPN